MTTIKHDFGIIVNGSDDIVTNTFFEVNSATSELLGVGVLLVVFAILFNIFMTRTQDIGKSAVSALHVSVLLGVVIYYWGKSAGFVGVFDSILLLLIILDVGLIAFLKYNRQDQT